MPTMLKDVMLMCQKIFITVTLIIIIIKYQDHNNFLSVINLDDYESPSQPLLGSSRNAHPH